jgi:hypothetical protein
VTKPPSTSSPLTTDKVDKMYYQLVEIDAIAVMQLLECACWRWSDSTPSLVQVGTIRQRPAMTPFVARLAPSPPTDFSS